MTKQLPNKHKTTAVKLGSWAVEIRHTMCIKKHKTTAVQAEKNCRDNKKQLPKQQKTTAEA